MRVCRNEGLRVNEGFEGSLAFENFEDFKIYLLIVFERVKMWLPWKLKSREFVSGFLMIAYVCT